MVHAPARQCGAFQHSAQMRATHTNVVVASPPLPCPRTDAAHLYERCMA